MPVINLRTIINAPVTRCFDLARSIDLHKRSMSETDEEAVAGVMQGLIGEGQTVTWRARHFGTIRTLTSKITSLTFPHYFRDEMLQGPFRLLQHDHLFEARGYSTVMTDHFRFKSPYWILGKMVDYLLLRRYLKILLQRRNQIIKSIAENGEWESVLNNYYHEITNT